MGKFYSISIYMLATRKKQYVGLKESAFISLGRGDGKVANTFTYGKGRVFLRGRIRVVK